MADVYDLDALRNTALWSDADAQIIITRAELRALLECVEALEEIANPHHMMIEPDMVNIARAALVKAKGGQA